MVDSDKAEIARGTFFYGWVIVIACTVLMAVLAGVIYSFGIFFKPLAADLALGRAATSGVNSVHMVVRGIFAIPTGWLADRFGPARIVVLCSLVTGLGLVLTSNVHSLWQFYIAYGLIVGIGVSGIFTIGTATTARWFVKHRGLALGLVSAGIGVGTIVASPLAERLVAAYGWSGAYLIFGVAALVIMLASGVFLRRDPAGMGIQPYGLEGRLSPATGGGKGISNTPPETGTTLRAAALSRPLLTLMAAYFLFSFCLQIVLVHLVNYATDIGISPLVASFLLSVIGIGSLTGRLVMGPVADRVGSRNALAICCAIVAGTLLWLVFSRELWMLYVFAIVFGFAYGGEIPQMAALIGDFFGLRAVAALVGAVVLGNNVGGALGSWMAGEIFDATQSYQIAFVIAAAVGFASLAVSLLLKRIR